MQAQSQSTPELPTAKLLSTAAGGPGTPPPTHLWHDWLSPCVAVNPDSPALISLHQSSSWLASYGTVHTPPNLQLAPPGSSPETSPATPANPDHEWTYTQLATASQHIASFLSTHGIKHGDAIATFLWNSAEWVVFFWAALRLSAVFVPLDPRALGRPAELGHLLASVEPRAIVVLDVLGLRRVDAAMGVGAVGGSVRIVCWDVGESEAGFEAGSGRDWFGIDELGRSQEQEQEQEQLDSGSTHPATTSTTDSDAVALVLFTSGTTNAPKGCALTTASFSGSADSYRRQTPAGFAPSTRLITTTLNFRPLFFLGCFATWRSGGTVVISGPGTAFSAADIIRATCEHRGTHFFLVPTQLLALARDPALERFSMQNVKFINLTGDVTNAALLALCRDRLGAASAASIWGMTEGVGVLGWERAGDVVVFRADGLSGVGRVMAGGRVRVCVPGTRMPVERGTLGDLHVGGSVMIKRYLGDVAADSFYTDEEGDWMVVGDHAVMDDDGVVFILGRGKDTIIREGVNLVPGVIEGCLNKDKGLEAQVVGIPHAEQGAVPVAIVKADGGLTEASKQSLADRVTSELGYEHTLDGIYTLDDLGLEKWPLNSTGKVMKRDLKDAVVSLRSEKKS